MSSIVEIVETPVFNASFAVTELLMKTLENAAKLVAVECVKACGNQYGFNSEEAIRMLGLENLSLTRKPMAKKSAGTKKTKAPKEPKAPKETEFPFPFCYESVNSTCCQGINYNRGLFTQCSKDKMENSDYCKVCQADALTNSAGIPSCGNVEMRLDTGLYDYKDTKGRKPVSYSRVLNKLKLTKEGALEAAAKNNIVIDELHFQGKEKTKKSASSPRGRPKKPSAVVNADGASDLFAQLQSEDSDNSSDNESQGSKITKKSNKLSEEEKAAKKAQLEEERLQKKAEREAKAAAEKAEKEKIRKAKAASEKAERDAKAAHEKAEREAKRNQEKAEREAKRLQEKAEKGSKKGEKQPKNAKKSEPENTEVEKSEVAQSEKPKEEVKSQKVTVTRIKIADVEYLKSSTNILYNPKTKEEVGLYDPATKTLLPLPDDDEDEEEEEGYESE